MTDPEIPVAMPDIPIERLAHQQLEHSTLTHPGEVVAYMGAMQAQDFAGAKWSVGLRLPGSTDAGIEEALAGRTIVRTWAFRGTLHFVAAPDVRWLIALVAPQIIGRNTRRYGELGLDEATLARSNAVLAEALQGGRQLDRPALREILENAGIATGGQRLPFMLQRASLEGLVCQTGMRRNNPVYVSAGEWLPEAGTMERDEALAELATRYFTSRGPATPGDFAGWSGLPAADVRAGLDAVRSHLTRETIDGNTYWYSRSPPAGRHRSPGVCLLPGFDEYVVGYRDRSAVLDVLKRHHLVFKNGMMSPTIVIDGRIAGTWKRTIEKGTVAIASYPFTPLTAAEEHAFAAAARRYGEFLGRPVVWE
jgi:hypothetical protein